MGILDWSLLGFLRAGRMFNKANGHWRQIPRLLDEGNEVGVNEELVEVVRFCQQAISANCGNGDAYVLLASALWFASIRSQRTLTLDSEAYEYLLPRAAAVAFEWHLLPHRTYKTTNTGNADRMWKDVVNWIMQDKTVTKQAALELMKSYRCTLAAHTISPNSFAEIREVILRRSKQPEPNRPHPPQGLDEASTKERQDSVQVGSVSNQEILRPLLEAAADCGLDDPDATAIDVFEYIDESMKTANKAVADYTSKDLGKAFVEWWEVFLTEYSRKINDMWWAEIDDTRDYQSMERLWLERFEPLWAAGCSVMREIRLKSIRDSPMDVIAKCEQDSVPVTETDREKMERASVGMASDYGELMSKIIAQFKERRRNAMAKALEDLRDLDNKRPQMKRPYTGN